MVYENCKIGNKYICKDGRIRIYITFPDKTNSVISYPKYLMEVHLDRYLLPNETVDHIDCNPLNNNIENLRVLDRKEHIWLDEKRYMPETHVCPICKHKFVLDGKRLLNYAGERYRANVKAGPFCSKRCAGLYGSMIREHRIDKLPRVEMQKLISYKEVMGL